MEQKKLYKKSFTLGLNVKELPLEPEPIDRQGYNLGLNISKEVEKFYSNLIMHSRLFRLEKSSIDEAKETGYDYEISNGMTRIFNESSDEVKEEYTGLVKLIDSKPLVKEEVGKVKVNVEKAYTEFSELKEKVLGK